MNRFGAVVVGSCAALAFAGCSHRPATTSTSPGARTAEHLTLPKGKLPVTLAITDVAISTAAQPVLRIGFKINNGLKTMQLCDPTYFEIELAGGSTIPADQAADNTCSPDSLDPKATGTARMYFDLTAPYTGQLALLMLSRDGKTVGATTTTLH